MTSTSALRHRKSSSEPSSPSQRPRTTATTQPELVPMVEQSTTSSQAAVQITSTSLSLTSLLTTLTTTEAITTTAKKLYTYPTKRLSSSDLWRKYKSDEETTSSPGSVTPPPDYEEESLAITSANGSLPSQSSIVPMNLPLSKLSQQSNSEDASLVSAKFANQGHNLLSLSLSEPPNSSFRRHLYLDSLIYLLRALPSDLSPAETTQILSALPQPLIAYLQPNGNGGHLQFRHIEHPTIHNLLSLVTSTTVSSIRNLTPHVKSLAQTTWEYNVKYRLAERGFERVKSTMDSSLRFWRAVAEWVMFEDDGAIIEIKDGEREGQVQVVSRRRKVRFGGGVLRNVGRYAGGIVRSGVGGVMEGFVEGMKV
ncbi:hypothetical protein ABW19_dt0209304 [Dactylella cylindrospora]|nr:hypothetical protein ABW19_dt0209304 [Dactylella cylindrospora]